MTRDGHLSCVGRTPARHLIKTGGEKVHPAVAQEPGASVRLGPDPDRFLFFDGESGRRI